MTPRLRTLLVALLAACGPSPYDDTPCLPGAVRSPGPACAAPDTGFHADGDIAKWRSGRAALVGGVRVARDGDRSLLFHFGTGVEPPRDGSLRWVLEIRDPDMVATDPHNHMIHVIVGGARPEVRFNGVSLGPLSVKTAFTEVGVEIEVPIDLLPFDGEAIMNDHVLVYRDGSFVEDHPFPFGYSICWDPTNVENGCKSPL